MQHEKNQGKPRFSGQNLSLEAALAHPKYADFANELAHLAMNDRTVPYHRSYLLAAQDFILERIEQIKRDMPGTTLKEAVSLVLDDLPNNLDARLLLELTRFTIETWENVAFEKVEQVVG